LTPLSGTVGDQKDQKKFLISENEMRKKESSLKWHQVHQWDEASEASAA
jgi:hypothetical protein